MLVLLLTSLVLASTGRAEAQRVLVVLKSQQTFKAVDHTFKTQGRYGLKGFDLGLGSVQPLSQINAQVENSFSNINTLVLNVKDGSELEKLKQNPEIAFVEKEIFHPAPQPYHGYVITNPLAVVPLKAKKAALLAGPFTATDKTPWGISAVHAPEAWMTAHSGAGARVLILDTGIDKDHPSLKDNFERGQDFVGDGNTPYEFADSVGHGSHVAGTIAGEIDAAGFTGVAPQAKILAGRVCSKEGCSNIAIAAGINWGIQQKVDVISMSLGGALSTPGERNAIAAADQAGLIVVAAAGNDGATCHDAVCRVSYPGALPTAIAVGAVDSTLKKADFSQYGPELAVVAPGVAVISSVPLGSGRDPEVKIQINGQETAVKSSVIQGSREVFIPETKTLVDCALGKPEDFAKVDVKGKYALISRGEISFGDKVNNAISAGAVGTIIYNNAPGLINGTLSQDGSVVSAAVFMVEQSVGNDLLAAVKAGQPISATLVVHKTDYSAFDGTSMATPHVSGVVALMKATNKNLRPADVKAILKQTAQPLGPNNDNEYGSGFINAQAAVQAAAVFH